MRNPETMAAVVAELDDLYADGSEVSFQALPGDLIVLYSDGLEYQQNPALQHFGRKKLAQLVESQWQLPPRDLVDAVFAGVDSFSEGSGTFDDQTLIVIKVK